jgi:hypothetical protein
MNVKMGPAKKILTLIEGLKNKLYTPVYEVISIGADPKTNNDPLMTQHDITDPQIQNDQSNTDTEMENSFASSVEYQELTEYLQIRESSSNIYPEASYLYD